LKINFTLELLPLPLRYEWKLSRNSSTQKINGFISARSGTHQGKGEAAPNIRYLETPERLEAEFEQALPLLGSEISPESWNQILANLPVCQALKMGLDMAFQGLMASFSAVSVEENLKIPASRTRDICYTIPVMEPDLISEFMERENLGRFSWLKLKVNKDLAIPLVEETLRLFPGPIAIDGNEAFSTREEALLFAKSLPPYRILFLEQPLPAAMKEEFVWLKDHSPVEIWGDESILSHSEPEYWQQAFSGINVKLMKDGSYQNAIEMLQTARTIGLKTMVGCMVETSLGISAALRLESLADYMDLDGFLLLENEPFGLISEEKGRVSKSATT